jgi:hypothetical protein
MTRITKTEAIRQARAAVSAPIRHGTSWQVILPYGDNPSGPSTTRNFDSYAKARTYRTRNIAYLALRMLGAGSEATDEYTYNAQGSVESIVAEYMDGHPCIGHE